MLTRIAMLGMFALCLLGAAPAMPAHAQGSTVPMAGYYRTFYAIDVKFKSTYESWTRWGEYPTRLEAELYALTLLRTRNLADLRIVTVLRFVPTTLPQQPPTLPYPLP